MEIKVFGPGCSRCTETENIVKVAIQETALPARVEKITDLKAMMAHGILSTPAVVIDQRILCAGRVPSRTEVCGWIRESARQADKK